MRWWRRWLGGRSDTPGRAPQLELPGPRPALRAWMQEGFPHAADDRLVQPGRWVAEEEWPSPRIEPRPYPLGTSGERVEIPPDAAVGLASGAWCPFGHATELAGDQATDDVRSRTFDFEVGDAALEILGEPVARIAVESDRPRAFVAARLCDVHPDGRSRLVSYGVRNLALEDGLDAPRELVPGRAYDVAIPLRATAYSFAPGHRIRLALSSSLWPLVWPSPEPARLVVHPGRSVLELPVRSGAAGGLAPEPDGRAGSVAPRLRDPAPDEAVRRVRLETSDDALDIIESELADGGDIARHILEDLQLTVGWGSVQRYRLRPADPLSATCEVERRATLERPGWHVRLEVSTAMTATADTFELTGELTAELEGRPFFQRRWEERVPRRTV